MKKDDDARRSDAVTAEEMRGIERAAIQSGEVLGEDLMARAAIGVVRAIKDARPDLVDHPGRAVVLCGPGNNGGDGYGVASLLGEDGWCVEVFALGDPERVSGDARIFRDRWLRTGKIASLDQAAAVLGEADLVVDALFGIGLSRPLGADVGTLFFAIPDRAFRVAVDVPSGRDTDTGAILGQYAFPADLTVTFHAIKPVHLRLMDEGGAVQVADIGL